MNFCSINQQVTICSIIMQTQRKFRINFSKINRIHFSADNECSPNPCVGPFSQIKMSFPLLSILIEEFMSIPKIATFFPVPPLGCEKFPDPSNRIP